ncbi:MAG TPA: HAD-IC family P-type ATPase, partial [Anaerolineae bacterium]|nr:HAD-IC family P-type ATPase [Anaerolineae bacterium]
TLTDTARLGVELKVLTGDEPLVTANISHRVGIDIKGGRIILGPELDGLEPREMEEIVSGHNIFCRVNPEQKLKVVTALHNIGHVVGFLGDGINDAPALRTADVGISVDTAVDVAKDAADIILLKKSLRVINNGIIEGRRIFGNITKYILNTVSANFGNMITVAGASLLLPFIPLLPAQILLNNILSDIPLVTISTDNVDPELTRRPRRWDIHLISRFMLTFGLLSTMFDFVTIGLLAYILMARVSLFRTGWFLESLISEIVVTFAIRTTKPFFKSRPSEALILSSLIIGLFSFAILYIPLGRIFNFIPLPGWLTIAIIAIVAAYFGMAEIYKRRFFKSYGL